MAPACASARVPVLSAGLTAGETDSLRVVPLRIADQGGSGVLLDDAHILTVRHAIPWFMLEAFASGGSVGMRSGDAVDFAGVVLGFGPGLMRASVAGEDLGCVFTLRGVGESNSDADDWAVLGTDEAGCMAVGAPMVLAPDAEIADGARVLLLGYPGLAEGGAGDDDRKLLVLRATVDHAGAGKDADGSGVLLRVRLDDRGSYPGMSGGAVALLDERGDRLVLIGIIVGSEDGPGSRGASYVRVRRVPGMVAGS